MIFTFFNFIVVHSQDARRLQDDGKTSQLTQSLLSFFNCEACWISYKVTSFSDTSFISFVEQETGHYIKDNDYSYSTFMGLEEFRNDTCSIIKNNEDQELLISSNNNDGDLLDNQLGSAINEKDFFLYEYPNNYCLDWTLVDSYSISRVRYVFEKQSSELISIERILVEREFVKSNADKHSSIRITFEKHSSEEATALILSLGYQALSAKNFMDAASDYKTTYLR